MKTFIIASMALAAVCLLPAAAAARATPAAAVVVGSSGSAASVAAAAATTAAAAVPRPRTVVVRRLLQQQPSGALWGRWGLWGKGVGGDLPQLRARLKKSEGLQSRCGCRPPPNPSLLHATLDHPTKTCH